MKKYLGLLLIFSLYTVLPAVAQRARPQAATSSVYIPESAVAQMQKKEKLPAIVGQRTFNRSAKLQSSVLNTATVSGRRSGNVASTKVSYKKAPIEQILGKQPYSRERLNKYKKSIVKSSYLLPKDLENILNKEFKRIREENARMQYIKANWNKQSMAYKFVNYQLNTQIDKDIAQSRKLYQNREKAFRDFLKTAPKNKYVSVIEATDNLFWQQTVHKLNVGKMFLGYKHSQHNLHYVSIFDHEYKHIFSYHRMHRNANSNRRILAVNSGDKAVDAKFQRLFDDYNTDLYRIGLGLDIINPTLLQQINEMKNRNITESY